MKTISACWIAKNEEANIERSINSVKGLVDELIVVDTGSTDNTAAVAASLGARVCPFDWVNDFSAARNHALEQATGDCILFLDADEWFEPALGEAHKQVIATAFQDSGTDGIFVPLHNMNMITGLVFDTSHVLRFYRRRADIRYHRKIHESLFRNGTDPLRTVTLEGFPLMHSGYSPELMYNKGQRNIQLLESIDSGDEQHYVNLFYLMRENHNNNHPDEAFRYMMELATHPAYLRSLVKAFPMFSSHFFYLALDICREQRAKVSRRFVRERIVEPMKKLASGHPGVYSIDLLYGVYFDNKEDKLLQGLETLQKRNLPITKESGYANSIATIYGAGAKAAMRRGLHELAFDYASKGLIDTTIYMEDVVKILLNCLRGQEEVEIVAFLSSIIDISNAHRLNLLVNSLKFEGYQSLYIYYLKKQIDQGQATKGSFLYLMILLGKFDEVVKSALGEDMDAHGGLVQEALFLAAVCGNREDIYRDHREILGGYARILDSYFTGYPLQDVSITEIGILQDQYHNVAFAMGVDAADRFLQVFSSQRQVVFFQKAHYCVESGLYELALRDPSWDLQDDYAVQQLLVQANCSTGRYEQALEIVERFLDAETFYPLLFHVLLVIAEKASPDTAKRAQALYTGYRALYDEYIDLQDMLQTGIAFDDASKQQKSALATSSYEKFQREVDELGKLNRPQMTPIRLGAAGLYLENDMVVMAERCYRRVLACGDQTSEVYEKLIGIYEQAGNDKLAARLRQKSASAR